MKALQQLENVFVTFQRLNQILNDNWTDDNSKAFDEGVTKPIATEFAMYHSSVQEMQGRAKQMEQEIDEDISELDKALQEAFVAGDCRLNGYFVFRTYYHEHGLSTCRPFLVSPKHYHSMDGDKSEYNFYASGKFPGANDIHDTYEADWIHID